MDKQCRRCRETLSIEEFYKHRQMADGRLNKCKKCCRADAVVNRINRLEYYRDYDRLRLQTDARKSERADRQRRYRIANKQKQIARSAVARAVRRGELQPLACAACGCDDAEAHHDDYTKPLEVRWLCRKHHLIEHGNYKQCDSESEVMS